MARRGFRGTGANAAIRVCGTSPFRRALRWFLRLLPCPLAGERGRDIFYSICPCGTRPFRRGRCREYAVSLLLPCEPCCFPVLILRTPLLLTLRAPLFPCSCPANPAASLLLPCELPWFAALTLRTPLLLCSYHASPHASLLLPCEPRCFPALTLRTPLFRCSYPANPGRCRDAERCRSAIAVNELRNRAVPHACFLTLWWRRWVREVSRCGE